MADPTQQKAFKKRLSALVRKTSNRTCCDCWEKAPTWAAILEPQATHQIMGARELVAFICFNCAACHRQLGPSISKVKSIALDEWNEYDVVSAERSGNKRVNYIYEAKLKDHEANSEVRLKPMKGCHGASLQRFINEKYAAQTYYSKSAHYQYLIQDRATHGGDPSSNNTSSTRRRSLTFFMNKHPKVDGGEEEEGTFIQSETDVTATTTPSTLDFSTTSGSGRGKRRFSLTSPLSKIKTPSQTRNSTGSRNFNTHTSGGSRRVSAPPILDTGSVTSGVDPTFATAISALSADSSLGFTDESPPQTPHANIEQYQDARRTEFLNSRKSSTRPGLTPSPLGPVSPATSRISLYSKRSGSVLRTPNSSSGSPRSSTSQSPKDGRGRSSSRHRRDRGDDPQSPERKEKKTKSKSEKTRSRRSSETKVRKTSSSDKGDKHRGRSSRARSSSQRRHHSPSKRINSELRDMAAHSLDPKARSMSPRRTMRPSTLSRTKSSNIDSLRFNGEISSSEISRDQRSRMSKDRSVSRTRRGTGTSPPRRRSQRASPSRTSTKDENKTSSSAKKRVERSSSALRSKESSSSKKVPSRTRSRSESVSNRRRDDKTSAVLSSAKERAARERSRSRSTTAKSRDRSTTDNHLRATNSKDPQKKLRPSSTNSLVSSSKRRTDASVRSEEPPGSERFTSHRHGESLQSFQTSSGESGALTEPPGSRLQEMLSKHHKSLASGFTYGNRSTSLESALSNGKSHASGGTKSSRGSKSRASTASRVSKGSSSSSKGSSNVESPAKSRHQSLKEGEESFSIITANPSTDRFKARIQPATLRNVNEGNPSKARDTSFSNPFMDAIAEDDIQSSRRMVHGGEDKFVKAKLRKSRTQQAKQSAERSSRKSSIFAALDAEEVKSGEGPLLRGGHHSFSTSADTREGGVFGKKLGLAHSKLNDKNALDFHRSFSCTEDEILRRNVGKPKRTHSVVVGPSPSATMLQRLPEEDESSSVSELQGSKGEKSICAHDFHKSFGDAIEFAF